MSNPDSKRAVGSALALLGWALNVAAAVSVSWGVSCYVTGGSNVCQRLGLFE